MDIYLVFCDLWGLHIPGCYLLLVEFGQHFSKEIVGVFPGRGLFIGRLARVDAFHNDAVYDRYDN